MVPELEQLWMMVDPRLSFKLKEKWEIAGDW